MKRLVCLGTLLLVLAACTHSPPPGETGAAETSASQLKLTVEDLVRLKQDVTASNQKSVSDRGHWIHCLSGVCRVSCQPRQVPATQAMPPGAQPGLPPGLQKDPLGRDSQCWVTLKPVNIDAYLKLIEEAKATGGRKSDPPGIADCDAAGCLVKTGM